MCGLKSKCKTKNPTGKIWNMGRGCGAIWQHTQNYPNTSKTSRTRASLRSGSICERRTWGAAFKSGQAGSLSLRLRSVCLQPKPGDLGKELWGRSSGVWCQIRSLLKRQEAVQWGHILTGAHVSRGWKSILVPHWCWSWVKYSVSWDWQRSHRHLDKFMMINWFAQWRRDELY